MSLYRLNGQTEEIQQLSWSSNIGDFTNNSVDFQIHHGNQLLFTAYHPQYGRELFGYSIDTETISLFKDMTQTPLGVVTGFSLVQNSNLTFFEGKDPDHGASLWKTDGTVGGTSVLQDLDLHSEDQYLRFNRHYHVLEDQLFFNVCAQTTVNCSAEQWTTNGTLVGTNALNTSSPQNQLIINDQLMFNTSTQLHSWKQGAVTNIDLPGIISEVKAFGDQLLLRITESSGNLLYISDGTAAGTHRLGEFINTTIWLSNRIPILNDQWAFFTVDSKDLWKTDGTPEGTMLVKEGFYDFVNSSHSRIDGWFELKDFLMFRVSNNGLDSEHQDALWKTDGTDAGTVKVKDSIAWAANNTVLENDLFFSDQSKNLWRSDGTPEGTVTVAEGVDNRVAILAYNGHLFFQSSGEFWKVDGDSNQLSLVVGNVSESIDRLVYQNQILLEKRFQGLLLTDGTPEGTRHFAGSEQIDTDAPLQTLVDGENLFIFNKGKVFLSREAGPFLMIDLSPLTKLRQCVLKQNLLICLGEKAGQRELWSVELPN